MPLCSDNRRGKMRDGFRGVIRPPFYNLQIFTGRLNTLMMIAVDYHMRAKESVQKRTGQIFGRVKDIRAPTLMEGMVGNFPYGAVKIQIDKLHPLADAHDGFFHTEEQIKRRKLFQIKSRQTGGGTISDSGRCFLAGGFGFGRRKRIGGKCGKHIPPAGQKKAVKKIRVFPAKGAVRKNDSVAAGFLQSVAIVFLGVGRTDYSNLFHGDSFRKGQAVLLLL